VHFAEGVCREERGKGGLYRGASMGEGLEFGGVLGLDGGGDVRARPDSDEVGKKLTSGAHLSAAQQCATRIALGVWA
jgi:hypothetical protein